MQIAKLQESEQDVRWEHKDDVNECHKCHKSLTNNKDKVRYHSTFHIFFLLAQKYYLTFEGESAQIDSISVCVIIVNYEL
jgi:hypothetical protein